MCKLKKVAVSLCFVIVLGIILSRVSFVFERKESEERYSEFWQEPGDYDVWFIGTSHIYDSIDPMMLWKQHGIRSFDLAAPGSLMPQTYWTMMCALQYGEPKVMVLDPHKARFNDRRQMKEEIGTVHTGFDSIPFSLLKIRGICDIFDTWEERFEYICKFSIYHNRWDDLSKKDFILSPSVSKGFYFNNNLMDGSDYEVVHTEKVSDMDTLGFFYLRKIIEACKERDIELLLIGVPFCRDEEEQSVMNAVAQLAGEYGVKYQDLTDEDIVDYGVDYGDRGHANLFGAKKITSYIGGYLSEHYDLPDYRSTAEVAEEWDSSYRDYQQYKLEKVRKAGKIKPYVQWLASSGYTCYLYQKKEPGGMLKKEIEQLDNVIDITLKDAERKLGRKVKGGVAFFVEDADGKRVDTAVFKKGKRRIQPFPSRGLISEMYFSRKNK